MMKTIVCSMLGMDMEATKAFLDSQGITFAATPLQEVKFSIEIKDCPSVIYKMERFDSSPHGRGYSWSILTIANEGIALYWAHIEAGDGYLFIPMSNILCFHTVSEEDIMEMKRYAEVGL